MGKPAGGVGSLRLSPQHFQCGGGNGGEGGRDTAVDCSRHRGVRKLLPGMCVVYTRASFWDVRERTVEQTSHGLFFLSFEFVCSGLYQSKLQSSVDLFVSSADAQNYRVWPDPPAWSRDVPPDIWMGVLRTGRWILWPTTIGKAGREERRQKNKMR